MTAIYSAQQNGKIARNELVLQFTFWHHIYRLILVIALEWFMGNFIVCARGGTTCN